MRFENTRVENMRVEAGATFFSLLFDILNRMRRVAQERPNA